MTNRLVSETSPYLLQHAANPVDWYPWGNEALNLARNEDRPIFLSIGYSACHWCHVMERESFQNLETAALMNARYVNIKVDREERPDVDSIYIQAVQLMTGQGGGWPLSVFLTPEGAPFYGGTYFPPVARQGLPSFRQVLSAAANLYHSKRLSTLERGEWVQKTLEGIGKSAHGKFGDDEIREGKVSSDILYAGQSGPPGRDFDEEFVAKVMKEVVVGLHRRYDPLHGGFGRGTKFPQSVLLDLLLRAGAYDRAAVDMALHTLLRMAQGGIRDHVGGGFHRYTVDARWRVPHFEKMLYDNALNARALTRAHLLGVKRPGAEKLGAVAEETLDYVLCDLTSPEGVFYSSRDADSEGEEGTFYLWTLAEVEELLGQDAARLFCQVYDVSEAGNFEGRNILHLPHDLDVVARRERIKRSELDRTLKAALTTLQQHRDQRLKPTRDEKVITSWNGLAIRALAEAGPALGRPDYTEGAARAASFLLATVRDEDGRLARVWAGGKVHINGFLEDYGALGNACLSLYEATLEPRWLEATQEIIEVMIELFWETEEGVFYDSAHDDEVLLVRPRDLADSATPSGNSLALELLARSAAITDSKYHASIVERVMERDTAFARHSPLAAGGFVTALLTLATPKLEVRLTGSPEKAGELLAVAHRHSHPNRVILAGEEVPTSQPDHDECTAIVCVGSTCLAPATTPQELGERLATTGSANRPARLGSQELR